MLDICTSEGEDLQQHFESKYGKRKALFTHCDVTQKDNLAGQECNAGVRGTLDIIIMFFMKYCYYTLLRYYFYL